MRILGALMVIAVVANPSGARAGDHQADVFLAGSYLNAEGSDIKLAGWHASTTLTVPNQEWLGLTLDVSGHFLGGDENDPPVACPAPPCPQPDRTQLTFMVGPRFSPRQGPDKKGFHRMFFAHALVFGVVHRSGGPTAAAATSGAVALGIGYDCPVTAKKTWVPRFQADYVLPVSSDVGHGWRFSAGLVYRLSAHR